MEIETIKVGYLQTNCYILKKGLNAIIIDPGDDGKILLEKTKKLKIEALLITHHHPDHIGALGNFKNIEIIDNLNRKNTKNFRFEIIETKGHTKDSITYYFKEENIMFTGDFIFEGTIGRTDLDTGNYEEMKKSIEKIKTYPTNTKIYPGHGRETTLEKELKTNPFLQ